MSSKMQRKKARDKRHLLKRRAKITRIANKHGIDRWGCTRETWNGFVKELLTLNLKYLQQLLLDIPQRSLPDVWEKNLVRILETHILEKTLLK